jgi:hypothetical protein
MHEACHGNIGAVFGQRLVKSGAADDARDVAVLQHGKKPLLFSSELGQRVGNGIAQRQRLEHRAHELGGADVAQRRAHPHDSVFVARDENYEEANQRQHEPRLQKPHDDEQRGDDLPDHCGDGGGLRVGEPKRQRGAQQPAAVHRERGNEVEEEHRRVDDEHLRQNLLKAPRLPQIKLAQMERAEPHEQSRENGEVDQRPRDGDDHLLERVFGHFFERGHAADGQQGDALDADAETLGDEAVPEFVQTHTDKNQTDEQHGRRRAQPPAAVVKSEPAEVEEKDEKRGVNTNRNP